ncbi:MAG: peptidoglycan DD-metalloendopeptidase family protein [Sideroxyarcus sp.]|nr:peptidoglycan DD-metalloendopeptidase family protein [Sideroxyarcus sp.]
MSPNSRLLSLLLAVALSACGTGVRKGKAPVVEYGDTRRAAEVSAPRYTTKRHTVRAGETLYSIAFEDGLNYMEVAEYNGLKDPTAIRIGQQLELRIPLDDGTVDEQPATIAARTPKVGEIKTQPKVGRLLYSAEALARAERMQSDQAVAATSQPPRTADVAMSDDSADSLEWGMPAQGKLVAEFSRKANRKGIDIAGARGQAITASAAGKVVYAGSGLRGYGKLVIIKHNNTYLSAYAHNDRILVKEGQSVRKGQQIAEMGSTDADQVKLHFEIRRQGKPVDPARYLPLVKS